MTDQRNMRRLSRVLVGLYRDTVPGVDSDGAPTVVGWTPSDLEGDALIAAVDRADPALRWLSWPEPFEAVVFRAWSVLHRESARRVIDEAEAQGASPEDVARWRRKLETGA